MSSAVSVICEIRSGLFSLFRASVQAAILPRAVDPVIVVMGRSGLGNTWPQAGFFALSSFAVLQCAREINKYPVYNRCG